MRERPQPTDVRCPECNDEWLQGRMVCRVCRQPLRIRHRDLTAQAATYATEEYETLGTDYPAGADLFASWISLAKRFLNRRLAPAMRGPD